MSRLVSSVYRPYIHLNSLLGANIPYSEAHSQRFLKTPLRLAFSALSTQEMRSVRRHLRWKCRYRVRPTDPPRSRDTCNARPGVSTLTTTGLRVKRTVRNVLQPRPCNSKYGHDEWMLIKNARSQPHKRQFCRQAHLSLNCYGMEDPLLRLTDLLHFEMHETMKAKYAESQESAEVWASVTLSLCHISRLTLGIWFNHPVPQRPLKRTGERTGRLWEQHEFM